MKRFLLPGAAAACGALLSAGSAAGAVIISEYVEGSSNNKAIELYNTGSSPVDLTSFRLRIYFNGSTTPGAAIALAGSLAGGGTWVVSHSSASFATQADQVASLSFNGDDAIVLETGGTVVDRIGQVGVDPGTEWGTAPASTANHTLRRKPAVLSGDTDPAAPFDPSLQWIGFAQDTFDGLGTHAVVAIPEPQAWLLMALGLVGLAGVHRLRRQTQASAAA
jgi:predicted extracellular nuclease